MANILSYFAEIAWSDLHEKLVSGFAWVFDAREGSRSEEEMGDVVLLCR